VNLLDVIARERAARATPADVLLWDDGDGQAQIEAQKAAGLVGDRTVVTLVRWAAAPVDAQPAPLQSSTPPTAAERIAALRSKNVAA
jgi:hypothetical protein